MSIAILDLATQVLPALRDPLACIRARDPELACRADRLATVLCAELGLSYLHEGVERLLHLAEAADRSADILSVFSEAWCFGAGQAVEPFRRLVRELTDLTLSLHQQHLTAQRDLDWATAMAEHEAGPGDLGDLDLLWPLARHQGAPTEDQAAPPF